MLRAPTSETKTETAQSKSQLAPQPERELHPRLLSAAGPYSLSGRGSVTSSVSPEVQRRQALAGMQSTHGNQAVLRMLHSPQQIARVTALRPSQGVMVQRKCACGGSSETQGECEECKAKHEGTLQRQAATPTVFPTAGVIQTKLAINKPGDEYEQEADRVSEQVMRTPESQLQRACHCGGECPKCQTEQPEHGHESLQTKRVQASDTGRVAVPPIVHEVLRSPGQPLDSEVRAFMEPRFGHDFSRVRVHSGAAAEQSAQDVNAHAYTVGHNMVFGAGRFTPGTHEGRRLIAHELTHVMQQGSGTGPRLQRQAAPDVNKSAKFIEDTYRSGARQLDDPTLSKAASDVRHCREEGGSYCEILVTDDDINSMYAEWSLIESVYDGKKADKAISDHKLREVAQWAAAEKEPEPAAQGQAPQPGVAVGGLTALAPSTAPAPTGPGTLPSAGAANSNVAVANSNIAAEQSTVAVEGEVFESTLTAPKPIPVAAAGVATFFVFGIIVAVQLSGLGEFQIKLFAAGYKYLPSPRGVCMRGCHQGSQNLPHAFDFPEPVTLGPRSVPLFPPFPRPVSPPAPQPRPVPKDCLETAERLSRLGCGRFEAHVMQPDVRNPQADVYCHDITGSECEYWLYSPDGGGALAKFDGVRGREVIECKCGYDYYLDNLNSSNAFKRLKAMSIFYGEQGMIKRILSHLRYAQDCGLQYRVYVSSQRLANWIRDLPGPQVDVIVQPAEECD